MNVLQRGDRLVVSELSRLGRSLGQIVAVLDALAKAGVAFVAMKENIRIEGKRDIQTKVMTTLSRCSPRSSASSLRRCRRRCPENPLYLGSDGHEASAARLEGHYRQYGPAWAFGVASLVPITAALRCPRPAPVSKSDPRPRADNACLANSFHRTVSVATASVVA